MSFDTNSTMLTACYWAAQYLTLAIGLTLIYKVQRFGNFAQAEIMLVGAYIGGALVHRLSDRVFVYLVEAVIAAAAVALLVRG